MSNIALAEVFSAYPAGRYPTDGEFNGEVFREQFLIPRLSDGGMVCLSLDGVKSFADSFFEEALGGLYRRGFSRTDLTNRLKIVATEPVAKFFLPEIKAHIFG